MSPSREPGGWSLHRALGPALLLSLVLLWLNFLLTSRWAHVAGSINGPKRPLFLAALIATTLFAIARPRMRHDAGLSALSARLLAAAGGAFLVFTFVIWLPPSTWAQVPFLDDWPIRYQAALDMLRLIDAGTFAGWEWRFLGGYHSSSDATQGLGTLTYLPMKLLGPAVGFHVAHALLFASVPALVWLDLRLDPDIDSRVRTTAMGTASLFATGYGYFLMRSGDTNALGGVVMALTSVLGAHAARRERPWGAWVLVSALALTAYAHPGFFAYACVYLLLDAAVAHDVRSAVRAAAAIAAGLVASLPLMFESWWYPSFFSFNNVVYGPQGPIDWMVLARSLYYNVELLWQPGRWFNDYAGLSIAFVPISLVFLTFDRSRVRYYAAAVLLTLALMRLHNVYAGYVFLRPVHMLPVWMAPIVAVLLVHAGSAWLRWSLAATLALYVQVWMQPIPHVPDLRSFNATLVDRVSDAPGALVLLENNPHRNMNAEPGGTTERSRFGTHFEVLVAETTGRRLYSGGYSDGWQWNPWKGQVLAGGTLLGRAIASIPHDEFVAEMHRWGVKILFVWSPSSLHYLERDERFTAVWTDGTWTEFELANADVREVVTASGGGELVDARSHSAKVMLRGVRAGETVTVRTNFHPAWTADAGGRAVPLFERGGQMSFSAPCDADCDVTLRYPTRRLLIPVALLVAAGTALWIRRRDGRARR